MKFIDMFAGIGGFRSGLEQADHTCVGYIEFDKFARKSYQAIYNTKGEYTAHDIREVNGKELPEADIWTFGSPCQDISIAGKQKGLQGSRSSLFFEVMRMLDERKEAKKLLPSYLIMENVKALLSSSQGWDFATVLIEMEKRGYDPEWSLINSAQVVPQNRERVYIVGHFRGRRTAQVFPIRRQGTDLVRTNSKIEVVGNTSPTSHKSQNVISSIGISPTLTATDYKHPKQVAIKQIGNYMVNSKRKNPEAGRIYDPTGLSPTLNTMQGGNRQPKIIVRACITPGRVTKRQNGRRFKNQDEPSFTLSCQDRHGVLLKKGNNVQIRKLTPLECWRLQGFSDAQFTKAREAGISDSQLYKQAGNAVTVPVIKEIGKKLKLFDAREDF
ncbi:DNA cytosine methyltransferase [Lactobacillus johnsonii]|uniref:DNA cytosine methyltransferase n=1 Tax=Lactobacillus johnsonii TaxID=33959 RepID=UPI00109415C5|nr:DNA cytosine methyltransferase [Lactobacillus johnsonii]TGY25863.1 DNA cytosine methyltransferase [Lactobacillus johnsonii]